MRRDYKRTDRVADLIQRELADLVAHAIKDPRLGMITITAVEVSRELDHAKVFFSVMTGEQDAAVNAEVLNHAAGFLRRELGQRMRIRTVPQLHFIYDESIERGARMSALIEQAIAQDKQGDE